ncbi:LysR family transcriptional regulator [Paenibacillus filicis]|uniref:LysR family transcriptional regulator n=1 Tax=Paenibacillus gyeongsangnamensis TaxID=3388067 RepID=A0ABT4QHV5_9BACL|nr:LysR family transcriptional regulator [Paenibacillus filicis]MCZ8516425.1 LysR family transcriptional regulator [Paenibacillus filicis]
MELRHLEYFVAVCEELHFTKAAEKLGMSQPTLSQQIRSLENEVGTPLFDRIGKRIALTEAGRLLQEYSIQMFRTHQNAIDAIGELRNHQRGALIIGALPSDLDYRITQLLIDFHNVFPHVRLTVLTSVEIVKQVLEMEVDIGIAILPLPDERIVRIPLSRDEYVLVVPENHELAMRTSIELEELRHIRTVMYPKGFLGRELVDDCCRQLGFSLNPIMETTTPASLISLVKANVGATVQPLSLILSMNEPCLRTIRITGRTPARDIGIIYHADRFLSHAAKTFIQKLQDGLQRANG